MDWLLGVIVENGLAIDDVLESLDHLVKCFAVAVVLLALITHDLTNWDRENTDQLAREALENLVIDATGHRGSVEVIDGHGD